MQMMEPTEAFGMLPEEVLRILVKDPGTFLSLYLTSKQIQNRMGVYEKNNPGFWSELYAERFGRRADWIQKRIDHFLEKDPIKVRVERNIYLVAHVAEAVFPVTFKAQLFTLPNLYADFDGDENIRMSMYTFECDRMRLSGDDLRRTQQTDTIPSINIEKDDLYLSLSVDNRWWWGFRDVFSVAMYPGTGTHYAKPWELVFQVSLKDGKLASSTGYYVIGGVYRQWAFAYAGIENEVLLEFEPGPSDKELYIKSVRLPSFTTFTNILWSQSLDRSLLGQAYINTSANQKDAFNYFNDLYTGKMWAFAMWLKAANVNKDELKQHNPYTKRNMLDKSVAKDYVDKMSHLFSRGYSFFTRGFYGSELLEISLRILFPILLTLDETHHRSLFQRFLPKLGEAVKMEASESTFFNTETFRNYMFYVLKRGTNDIIPRMKASQLEVSCSTCNVVPGKIACPYCKEAVFCSEACYFNGNHVTVCTMAK